MGCRYNRTLRPKRASHLEAMYGQMEEREEQQLRAQIEELSRKLREAEASLEQMQRRAAGEHHAAVAAPDDVAPISEAHTTLRRLVQRIAMILQAEKVLMMFCDRESGELIGISPAHGIDENILGMVKMRATQGISGDVFREGRPITFQDAVSDKRTEGDPFAILHVQNGVTVPLVIERRDEENRIIDRQAIGVLHAFNKRHGEEFNEEDVRLLERMAKSAASIISNLRLYQQVVEEKEELLHTLESLYAGLVLVNQEGKITQMNASARTIFGVGPEAIHQDHHDVLRNKDVCAFLDNSMSGSEQEQIEASISLDGKAERTYQVQVAQVRGDDGRQIGTVAILNDVTDLKNIERMKSAFVATVSHELRTPLTAIKGFVSTLRMDDEFSLEERQEFYTIIDHECDRLTRLINDLLNIARIEAGESLKPNYGKVDIKQLMKKVLLIQKQSTHSTSRHTFVLDAPDEAPEIIGDQDKLDQILTNLINNAVKYSPEGGKVTAHLKVANDSILIGVQDEGIGIPKEHLAKVFDRFHRVHTEDNRKIYGTGLGLFLVQHLAEQVHLGKVWVESDLGVGSTFWVKLPIALDVEKAERLNN